jgi:hypothetical protein
MVSTTVNRRRSHAHVSELHLEPVDVAALGGDQLRAV